MRSDDRPHLPRPCLDSCLAISSFSTFSMKLDKLLFSTFAKAIIFVFNVLSSLKETIASFITAHSTAAIRTPTSVAAASRYLTESIWYYNVLLGITTEVGGLPCSNSLMLSGTFNQKPRVPNFGGRRGLLSCYGSSYQAPRCKP